MATIDFDPEDYLDEVDTDDLIDELKERAGREKKIQNVMLIPAGNVDEANERIKDALKPMIVDYEIVSIAESPIMDVFL